MLFSTLLLTNATINICWEIYNFDDDTVRQFHSEMLATKRKCTTNWLHPSAEKTITVDYATSDGTATWFDYTLE